MIADTHTYSTTQYILPVNCPEQTPDGFSVPGWERPGCAAGGQRRRRRWGGGGLWVWKSTAEGPYLAKRITSVRLASRLLSGDKNSLSLWDEGCKRLFAHEDVSCNGLWPVEKTAHSHNADLIYSVGRVFILHNNHESQLKGRQFGVVANVSGVGKELVLFYMLLCTLGIFQGYFVQRHG